MNNPIGVLAGWREFLEEHVRGGDDGLPAHRVREPVRPAGEQEELRAAPATPVQELHFETEDLARLRRDIAAWAAAESLEDEPVEELVLAVSELASNSIRHGGGRGCLRVWREQRTLLCEVRDRGHIEDLLPGSICPPPSQPSGRGLWLVKRLCDRVEVSSSPAHGTTVRVHKHLSY